MMKSEQLDYGSLQGLDRVHPIWLGVRRWAKTAVLLLFLFASCTIFAGHMLAVPRFAEAMPIWLGVINLVAVGTLLEHWRRYSLLSVLAVSWTLLSVLRSVGYLVGMQEWGALLMVLLVSLSLIVALLLLPIVTKEQQEANRLPQE